MATEFIRDSADSRRDNTIQGLNFGGLNTVASPLNMPYGDSPALLNVDITPGGAVSKRKGTRQLLAKNVQGAGMVAVRVASGRTLFVSKEGADIVIYSDKFATLMTKVNVFNGAAVTTAPVFIRLEDVEVDRVLILTGHNVPVQVCLREVQGTLATGSSTLTLVNTGLSPHATTPTLSLLSLTTPTAVLSASAVTHSTRTATITTSRTFTAPQSVSVLHVSWQWWAEAYAYFGNRFFDTASRFGVDVSDRHVRIPEQLLDGGLNYPESATFKAVYALRSLDPTVGDFFAQSQLGVSASDYWFSNGAASQSNDSRLRDANTIYTHLTFGTHQLTGMTPTSEGAVPVHLLRDRRLLFNGGQGFAMSALSVSQDKQPILPAWFAGATKGNAPTYYGILGSQLNAGRVNQAGLTQPIAHYVGFYFGSGSMGVPTNAMVRITNTDCAFIGSGALKAAGETHDQRPFKDGVAYPAYGLGEFANYAYGYFPTCGYVMQGRLFLGGVPNDPLRVIGSAITDTQVVGEFYNHFQIDALSPITGAYDIICPGDSEDFILGMGEKNGNLFVLSRQASFRIRPNESGGYNVSLLGVQGVTSRLGIIQAEQRLMFAGDRGLYEITESEGFSDSYTVRELSAKVSTLFKKNEQTILAYDADTRKVYIANGGRLLVYFAETGAFSQYQFHARPTVVYMVPSSVGFYHQVSVANQVVTLQTEYDDYIDFAGRVPVLAETVTLATANDIRVYRHNIPCMVLDNVDDLIVTLGGRTLTLGRDYFKRGSHSIYLYDNPGTTTPSLVVSTRYGVLTTPRNAPRAGYPYLAHWSTPKFYWGNLSRTKRVMHFSAMMSNEAKGSAFVGDPLLQGMYEHTIDVNVAFVMSDEQTGDIHTDLYGLEQLVWDSSFFDVFGNVSDEFDYRLIKESIQGLGYGFQAILYSYDDAVWTLAGYQIEGKVKGNRYRGE